MDVNTAQDLQETMNSVHMIASITISHRHLFNLQVETLPQAKNKSHQFQARIGVQPAFTPPHPTIITACKMSKL